MARTAPVPNIPPIPGMCPSIAVLGGGGDGGGGSGDGAGDGNGDGPGNGDGSGDGADGAGNGAGSCGNGTNGACTNCGHNVAAGDPVDVLTGEVFTTPKTDLFLFGPFNLELRRQYSSFSRKHDVGLGWGWSHSLAWRMQIRREDLVVRSGFGQAVTFPKLEVGESEGMKGWGLYRHQDGYVLRPGQEFFHVFQADPERPDEPLLRAIRFRNRGQISLSYDRGRLVGAIDAAGRTIRFAQTPEGRIASISVPDQSGQAIVFARYAYDGAGNLTEAFDADGHRFGYAYDDDRRLIAMTLPTKTTFHFFYDQQGRCVETWGDREDGPDPSLDPGLPTVLADGETKARGIFHAKIAFSQDGSTEVIDSARVQRFFPDPTGKISKAVNGRGGVTTRQIDDRGDVSRETDALGATWAYSHDPLGNVTSQTDAEGKMTRFKRDHEGRVVSIIDAAGGVVEHIRDRYGNVESSKDQAGAVTRFVYDERGLLTKEILPNGTSYQYTLDGHGNTTGVVTPDGASHRFEYDFWGRLVLERLADGRNFAYRHAPSGRLIAVTDSLGRTRSYTFDGLGNLIAEQLPDGTTSRYLTAGLGWIYAVEQPDGTVVRRWFNREGWLLRVENEAGEKFELEYTPTGVLREHRGFDGSKTVFKLDARDRIIASTDARGTTGIQRNKVGQVLKMTGPDGKEVGYAYDERGLLIAATTPGTRIEWDYDAAGKIVAERTILGEDLYAVANVRDVMGQRRMLSTSLGHAVEYLRTDGGALKSVGALGEPVIEYQNDPVGWPIRRQLALGGAIVDELDGAARLRRRFVERADAPPAAHADEPARLDAGTHEIDKVYQFTPIDEIASVTTTADGTTEFSYDLRRHLTQKQARGATERFRYDVLGNPFEADGVTRVYEPGSRLVSRGDIDYVYDKLGRVVERRERRMDATEVTRYEYNLWGQVSAVDLPDGSRIELSHDAFSRRVQKRVLTKRAGKLELARTTVWVWDMANLVHEIERRPGDAPRVKTFLYEDQSETIPIAEASTAQPTTRDWIYYVKDVSGSPEEMIDGAGRLLAHGKHTAYGLWSWTGRQDVHTSFRFQGQVFDEDTGLHENRFRTYDPSTGRYLTPDPILLDGGNNLYEYGPNPIAWVDPLGWQHVMTVTDAPPGFDPGHSHHQDGDGNPVYQSGMQGLDANHDLRSRARCHTEQRFAHDLNQTGRDHAGEHFQLQGQYPPCPNCHRALQNAAAQSGANVTYSWGNGNSITYHGGPAGNPGAAPPPTFNDGHQAQRLQDAYATTHDTDYRNNYSFDDHGRAQGAYSGIMNQFYR